MLDILLLLIVALIAVAIVVHTDLFNIVILYSIFSLLCATLYLVYMAPDVALAEAAIGSAFVPMIFIVAISKQREFIVLSRLEDGFLSAGSDGSRPGRGYVILKALCRQYGLKLVLCPSGEEKACRILARSSADIFVYEEDGEYIMEGKGSSLIMERLSHMLIDHEDISLVLTGDDENYD
ncbi:Na(+)/H(+) antiporter subunit B [Peptoclostridium acidaminophilum]|nr:DUF4040 domain-containing protein [Peptoclostridium acidaminophilum]